MTSDRLLSREDFSRAVFARDGGRCVACLAAGRDKVAKLDAHHILERKLWPDGGYYLGNGVSLCEVHHLAAEATTLSCEELRASAGISRVLLPPMLACGCVKQAAEDGPAACEGRRGCERYDKWGNPVLPNGQRMRGPFFEDEGVQRVLSPVLHLFTELAKSPRIFHLPWSPGRQADDRVLSLATCREAFAGRQVVVTEKLDGEGMTLYPGQLHARSLTSPADHPSRTWVKGTIWARIRHELPEGWRICGENVFAKHSIHYRSLPGTYFFVFSIWEGDRCLPWDETVEYAHMLGLVTAPVLHQGPYDEDFLRHRQHRPVRRGDACEGYVLRTVEGFRYREATQRVGKYVRAGHVQSSEDWLSQPLVQNGLADTSAPT